MSKTTNLSALSDVVDTADGGVVIRETDYTNMLKLNRNLDVASVGAAAVDLKFGAIHNGSDVYPSAIRSIIDGDGTSRETMIIHDGAMRFQVNGAGQVTTPYQASAVCYFGDINSYVQESLNWVFDNTEYNQGNCYNNSTGRFTCPVSGIYQVSIFTLSSSNTDAYYLVVRKNGAEVGRAYQYTRVGQIHLQVKCNAGDYLQVGTDSTTKSFFHGRHYTKASFHLLG